MSGWLALDLSKRSTGWAFWNGKPDQTARFGSWVLGSEYTSKGATYIKLHSNLAEMFQIMPFDRMFFEEPIHPAQLQGGTNIESLRVLSGVAAHAESFAAATGCRSQGINVSSWRGDFIGPQKRGTKRPVLKELTMLRCQQLGFSPRKDDEADAIGLLTYGILLNGVTPPWLANEVLRQPLISNKT
jgi:hypothetical protein